jgi:hypothetical protein
VLVEGVLPESDYRFKHALIQDAAYENLLKSRRQILHRRIAETLRDRFADKAAAEPEVLAHHFTQAGLTDAAIEWWGKAGDQALRRSAFQEAISHLGKAIEMADKASEEAGRVAAGQTMTGQRLRLQTAYGSALLHGRGMQSPETRKAFSRAQELASGPMIRRSAFRFTTPFGRATSFAANWRRCGKSRNFVCAKSKNGRILPKLSLPFASTARLNGSPGISMRRALFSNVRVPFSIRSVIVIRRFVSLRTSAYPLPHTLRWCCGCWGKSIKRKPLPRRDWRGQCRPATSLRSATRISTSRYLKCCGGAVPHRRPTLKLSSMSHARTKWRCGRRTENSLRRGRGADGTDAVLAEMRNGIATCQEQSIGNYIPFLTTALAEAEAQAGEAEQALATVGGVIGDSEREWSALV